MIQRRKYLSRSTTPIRRAGKRRRTLRSDYTSIKAAYLAEHPFCQISCHFHGVKEADVIAFGSKCMDGTGAWVEQPSGGVVFIPWATEIHHRNKCNGARLTDTRWFMSASRIMHENCENKKAWARLRGYLLDISANPDGLTPGGVQGLTTDELVAQIK